MNARDAVPWTFVLLMLCWSVAGIVHAYAKLVEAKYWEEKSRSKGNDDDEQDSSGDQPVTPKPVTPYDIDPQYDPSDWWKHDPKKRRCDL